LPTDNLLVFVEWESSPDWHIR